MKTGSTCFILPPAMPSQRHCDVTIFHSGQPQCHHNLWNVRDQTPMSHGHVGLEELAFLKAALQWDGSTLGLTLRSDG